MKHINVSTQCPYCATPFEAATVIGAESLNKPTLSICAFCTEFMIFENGELRKLTDFEQEKANEDPLAAHVRKQLIEYRKEKLVVH